VPLAGWVFASAYLDFAESHATVTEYVRVRLATFVNDLLSLGVVGLRIDAANRGYSDVDS
jgi:hypothetical protein